jgi:mycothiol synthase
VNLDLVGVVADAATDVDGAAPLDEATWRSLRAGDAGWSGVVTAEAFALNHGEDLHLVVHPDHRGRGLGAALLAGVEGPAQSWSHGGHRAAARLAVRFGFHRARDLWVMRRSAAGQLPPPPEVDIRAYTDQDAAELLRVNAEAFAGHPEQGAMDEGDLAARMAEPWFDPAGLLVVTEGPRMLGFHWTKQHSPDLGEVYVVGIDPSAQGRGLGRALTLAGLHHLVGLGVSEILLYVEADNHAALATYTQLGFSHADADTHVMYRRD